MIRWLSVLAAVQAVWKSAQAALRPEPASPPPPAVQPQVPDKPDVPARLSTVQDQRLNAMEASLEGQATGTIPELDGGWRATVRDVGGPNGSGSGEDKLRSFAYKDITGPAVTICKGNIHYSGRGTYPAAETGVTIAGTVGAPTYVYVRLSKVDTPAAEIVTSAVEAVENDTWWYFLLYTFYLNGSGVAVKAWDWRYDIRMGSPIR